LHAVTSSAARDDEKNTTATASHLMPLCDAGSTACARAVVLLCVFAPLDSTDVAKFQVVIVDVTITGAEMPQSSNVENEKFAFLNGPQARLAELG
jgi:hypothetical protein